MKNRLLIMFFLIILLPTGCREKTDEEIFYKAQKQILCLNTYVCTANITVYGNKAPEKYIVKQWFKAPNKYKIEVQSPENVKGKTTIYNGKKAFICHPRIGQEWLMEDFLDSTQKKMFLGHFISNFINTESSKLNRETIENNDYMLMEAESPGNHPYFNKERLWFDIKKYYPHRLQVLDKDDNIIIDVKYVDFRYNENIDDKIFTIKGKL